MRYPSCYVLATDMDDPSLSQGGQGAWGAKAAGLSGAASEVPPMAGPMSYADAACVRQASSLAGAKAGAQPQEPAPRVNLAEQVWQESMTVSPAEGGDVSMPWEFADPARKVPCTCSK